MNNTDKKEFIIRPKYDETPIQAKDRCEAMDLFALDFNSDLNDYFEAVEKNSIEKPKYRCNKSKEEILEIVVKHFKSASAEVDNKKNHTILDARSEGRYDIMWKLLHELEVYDE